MWVRDQLRFLTRALFIGLVALFGVLSHVFLSRHNEQPPAHSLLFPKGSTLSADSLHARFFPYADTMSARPSYPGAFDPFYSSFVYSHFSSLERP